MSETDVFGMLYVFGALGGICFIFGVVYPAVMALIYPFYRMLGGTEKFSKFMKNI